MSDSLECIGGPYDGKWYAAPDTWYRATYPSQRLPGMPWDVDLTIGEWSAVGFGYTAAEAELNALDQIRRLRYDG